MSLLLPIPTNFSYFKITKERLEGMPYCCFIRFSQSPKLIIDNPSPLGFLKASNSFEVLVN